MTNPESQNKKALWSWCFFDWANSGFTTLILTFVYGTYFTQAVASDPVSGASSWSYAIALSGLLMLVLGPVCGAIADQTGRLKLWVFISMILCVAGVSLMIGGTPHAAPLTILLVLGGLVIANTGFELSSVFYNALLPHVAKSGNLGKASSLGWAIGYAGGLLSLVIMLLCFIGIAGIEPFIPLPKDTAWHIRIAAPLVIFWFLIFGLPLFLFVPDKPKINISTETLVTRIMRSLRQGFLSLKSDKNWRNFLIGSALYRDGLNTLFAMGGIYAAHKYNLETSQILLFGIGMNVTAGIGAFAASFIEDRVGSFRVVRWSLAGLFLTGSCILVSDTTMLFFASALSLGLFVGPVQSASRTIVTKLSDKDVIAENYGFYALTGRAAAFLGPLFYGLSTDLFHSQNAGIATILIFWLLGFAFIMKLKDRHETH